MQSLKLFDGAGESDSGRTDAAIRLMDPAWHESLLALEEATLRGPLSPKVARLVWLAIHSSITSLNGEQIRECIRGALETGASKEEILAVLQLCTVLGIHAIAVAAPILKTELDARHSGIETLSGNAPTPTIDKLKKEGLFNGAWLEIESWDSVWLDRFLEAGMNVNIQSILSQRTIELLYIAIDVSVTHIYSSGTRRHMEAALKLGVEPEEILEVLKIASFQSMLSMKSGAKLLLEEIGTTRTPVD